MDKEREAFEAWFESQFESTKLHKFDDGVYWHERAQMSWLAWQAAKAQSVPEGFVLVPKELNHEQAVKISDDEDFFETYQTILAESDTSEDSAAILIQTAHKAMIEAQEPK